MFHEETGFFCFFVGVPAGEKGGEGEGGWLEKSVANAIFLSHSRKRTFIGERKRLRRHSRLD